MAYGNYIIDQRIMVTGGIICIELATLVINICLQRKMFRVTMSLEYVTGHICSVSYTFRKLMYT